VRMWCIPTWVLALCHVLATQLVDVGSVPGGASGHGVDLGGQYSFLSIDDRDGRTSPPYPRHPAYVWLGPQRRLPNRL
jgi:hypothetical protein